MMPSELQFMSEVCSMNRRSMMTAMMTGAAVLATRAMAQDTANVPVRPNTGKIAEENVKQLLLLMDTNKNEETRLVGDHMVGREDTKNGIGALAGFQRMSG
jgi:hypothetical protein